MAIKLLDGVAVTGNSERHELKETVKDHCIEVYFTDADTSITAMRIDLLVKCNALSTADFFTAKEHTLTSAELTAKKVKINVLNEPATEIKVGIGVLTGAGGGDSVDVWYHPVLITK